MAALIPRHQLADVSEAIQELTDEIANWSTEERAEAIQTLGDLAIVAGTRGHAMHRRVGEALVLLRNLTRSVDAAVESHFEKENGHRHP